MRDGGSASSGDCAGARGSSHDEGSDAATAALPPSHMFCRLESVVLQIDVETHELLATMQLQPIQEVRPVVDSSPHPSSPLIILNSRVPSSIPDTSTHGGFSIPRKSAEACLPHLDMTQSVPSQRITATDVLGNQWLFRHVYPRHAQAPPAHHRVERALRHVGPRCWRPHRLPQVRSIVSSEPRSCRVNRHGALKVAVRRSEAAMAALQAQRQARHAQRCSLDVDHVGDSAAMAHPPASPGLAEVASADAVLATAARSYSRRTAFSVTFHPWVSASTPFVIPLPDFTRGLHVKAVLQPGSEVRLTLETDDLATRRLRGTVLSLHHSPSATWPSSPWRSVQIKWGDTDGACCSAVTLRPAPPPPSLPPPLSNPAAAAAAPPAAAPVTPLAAGQQGDGGSWGPAPLCLPSTAPLSHTPLTSFFPNHSLPPRPMPSEPGHAKTDAMVWSQAQPAMEYSGSREPVTTATPATAATAGAGSASPVAPRPAFPRTLTAPGGFTAYAPASSRQGGVKREQQEEGTVPLTLSLGLSALTASPPSYHSSPILKRRRTTGLDIPVLRHACHSESDVARLLHAQRPERTDMLDSDLAMHPACPSDDARALAGGAEVSGGVGGPPGCLFTLPSSPSSASGGTPRSSNGDLERTVMEERAASGKREAAGGAESMDGQTASPSVQPASPCKLSPLPSRAANRRRIKLRVEGSPVMRTVDLSGIGSFQSLYATCAAMLQLPLQQPGQPAAGATCPWQLTYTDADGDTLLVGDGPWSIFLEHVQMLTVMKAPM
ncbi:unnamed protein product [Closterium sp. NIES-64]|nr:unnamed protein product [Closterium sp. NIES-64]